MIGYARVVLIIVVVNQLRWDFGRLLGVYVAVFVVASVLSDRLGFFERVPASTWPGPRLFVAGGGDLDDRRTR